MMKKDSEDEECLLIPVTEDKKLPPLEKIISLAKNVNLRIHIAGFVSGTSEISSLISQTIFLTKKLNEISNSLKKKISNVSAKIYATSFRRKINDVIFNEKVILIATSNASDSDYRLKELSNEVMILQISERDNTEAHDILLMHKIERDNIDTIAKISKLFGDRLYIAQPLNNEAVENLTRSFGCPEPAGLDRQANSIEINEWLLRHKAGLIALNKAELEKGKGTLEVLKKSHTPVLLY